MDFSFLEPNPVINVPELGKWLRRRRESSKLSLRAVAEQTQVSASTLSRIENGSGMPDTPTLAKLSMWLDVPLDKLMNAPETERLGNRPAAQSTPDFVEAHLRADRNLTPEKAEALAELFRIAYNQFAPGAFYKTAESGSTQGANGRS